MGVPLFYRWLVNKYPKVVAQVEDTNPNGIEFDNFYLDMNGIIHPCFHPEDNNLFPPTTFEDVFSSMFEYVDRLIQIVRPRKMLFFAIDGVAPRAKMNLQRASRFGAVKNNQIVEEIEEKLRKQFEREGKPVFPKKESEISDRNIITPGTEFMCILSKKFQDYISDRMKNDSAWSNIKVILSDANVPGEGEHKIISFIRSQRSSSGYDPNTRHCLHGMDADLIMLALATHEIHFSILREVANQFCYVTSIESSINRERAGLKNLMKWFEENICQKSCRLDVSEESCWSVMRRQPFEFVHIWVLREYLALDLDVTNAKNSEIDLERIIDDFVFICFFAGNDFLPQIPSLQMHEGCLDLLMHVYRTKFRNFGGYLVNMQKADDKKGGYMNLKRVEKFMLMVGSYEEKIFSKRCQQREKMQRRILKERGRGSDTVGPCDDADAHEELRISSSPVGFDTVFNNTMELKQKIEYYVQNQSDLFKDGGQKTDQVKFGTPGCRERYYEIKFNTRDVEATRRDVVDKYVEGLHWVLLSYFSSVPSWTWFYPYHYGPLASDFRGISQTRVTFESGSPLKPFDQLLAVLPPMSAHALPLAYKGLMIDPNSNIIDFYPTEFETDTDGKRYLKQGITKLPFIDEERLLTETKKLENKLTDDEKQRNSESFDLLFVRRESRLFLHDRTNTASRKIKDAIAMECLIKGIKGTVHLMPEDLIRARDNDPSWEDTRIDLCVFYEMNQGHANVHRLLENVTIPEKTIIEADLMETRTKVLWHEVPYVNRLSGCKDNYGAMKSRTWRRDNHARFRGLRISDLCLSESDQDDDSACPGTDDVAQIESDYMRKWEHPKNLRRFNPRFSMEDRNTRHADFEFYYS